MSLIHQQNVHIQQTTCINYCVGENAVVNTCFVVYVHFFGVLKTLFNQSYPVSYAHNVSLHGFAEDKVNNFV